MGILDRARQLRASEEERNAYHWKQEAESERKDAEAYVSGILQTKIKLPALTETDSGSMGYRFILDDIPFVVYYMHVGYDNTGGGWFHKLYIDKNAGYMNQKEINTLSDVVEAWERCLQYAERTIHKST